MAELNHHVRSDGLKRVSVPLEESDWHSYATEGLWAEPLPAGEYRIDNIPFYAYDLSYQDSINVEEVDGQLTFQSVASRGGHSTYRVHLREGLGSESSDFQRFWAPLEELGCSYEGAFGRLLAIDVPPEADIHRAYSLLENGEREGVWDFEEGHCGHPVVSKEEE